MNAAPESAPDLPAAVTDQIRDGLGAAVDALMRVLGPTGAMLAVADSVDERAGVLAAQLLGDDDQVAAGTALDVVGLLCPGGPAAEWWRTPVGQAVARSVGHPTAEVVSHSVAAAMIGVHKSHIGYLLTQQRLDRALGGGVTVVSVRQHLASRQP